MKIQAQTENKTIEQNLIWLEHEIKINEAVATSQETKAKVNVLSLAISSISELSSTIRELKSEIAELRTEVSVLRSSVKPKMSDEEKAIFREEARERLREFYNEYFNEQKKLNQLGNSDKSNLYYNQELLNSINDTGIEIIIIKSKTINEARRILNKLILILPRMGSSPSGFSQNYFASKLSRGHVEIIHNRDFKILSYVMHDMERMYFLTLQGEYGTNSILEGGIMKPSPL
jgi:predicted RNase H-like nuclease (RuvC/YqgF family)